MKLVGLAPIILKSIFFLHRPPKQPHTSLPPTAPVLTSSYSFPDHIGGYRLVHSTFSGVESRFGLVFPKLGSKPPPQSEEITPAVNQESSSIKTL